MAPSLSTESFKSALVLLRASPREPAYFCKRFAHYLRKWQDSCAAGSSLVVHVPSRGTGIEAKRLIGFRYQEMHLPSSNFDPTSFTSSL